MRCSKCNNRMRVIDTRHNYKDDETYRKLVCPSCGNIMYSGEFEVEYESIKELWGLMDRQLLKKEKTKATYWLYNEDKSNENKHYYNCVGCGHEICLHNIEDERDNYKFCAKCGSKMRTIRPRD